MIDYVNDHFKKFYPADHDTNWVYGWCGEQCVRKYKGEATNIFPLVVCRDGFAMSVQGHYGAYSYPRDDFAERYLRVEVLGPETPEFGEGESLDDKFLYGFVPIEIVNAVIEKHGGIDE